MLETGREVRLSMKEHQRVQVLREVEAGSRTQVCGGRILGVTDRWVRELLRRLRRDGPKGLIHGNRGRFSNRRISEVERESLVRLYRERYEDFKLTHFREMLERREGKAAPCRETLRRVLMGAGVWRRRRKAPRHRLRRPRREREGELVQMDASIHAWLGPERSPIALLGAVDDATGDVPYAQFFEAETTEGYFRVMKGIVHARGIPQAVYTDRDGVFVVNLSEPKRELLNAQGREALTPFGRALRELGVEWIEAHSPQAKGRIERLWGVFQDRLLKELRLEGIETIAGANGYLLREFLPRYRRQFRRLPARPEALYRPPPLWRQLEGILCWKESRVLGQDHTFSFEGQVWQVFPCDRIPALRGRRVEVRKTLRGQIQAWVEGVRLTLRQAPPTPPLASLRARPNGRCAALAAASRSTPSSLEKIGSFYVDRKPEVFMLR